MSESGSRRPPPDRRPRAQPPDDEDGAGAAAKTMQEPSTQKKNNGSSYVPGVPSYSKDLYENIRKFSGNVCFRLWKVLWFHQVTTNQTASKSEHGKRVNRHCLLFNVGPFFRFFTRDSLLNSDPTVLGSKPKTPRNLRRPRTL